MSFVIFISIIAATLLIILSANIYIPYRLSHLLKLKHPRIITTIFFSLTIIGVFAMGGIAQVENKLLLHILRIGLIWLGLGLSLLTYLLIFEGINIFRKLPHVISGYTIITLSLLTTAYSLFSARDYIIKEVTIPLKNLKQEISIFHIPDIHLGAFRGKEYLNRVVNDINKIKPDITIINGDLVDGIDGINPDTLKPLQKVKTPLFFTSGNHDLYVNITEVEKLLTSYGVTILDNKLINIDGIQLLGLNYMRADKTSNEIHMEKENSTIKDELKKIKPDQNKPLIIAHHSPSGIKYMNEISADLVLAGHTHGGQIFPASLIAKLHFGYLKGIYKYLDTTLYVTQGVGTFGPPMRLGTENEATLIHLTKKK